MIIDSTTKRPIPVAIMQHCSAATDLLRRKMGQWADTKNKESPSYRRRSAVSPIHNLARDMNNDTGSDGVHPVEPGGREFAICSQAQTLLEVRWHDCVRVSQNILEKAIAAWPSRKGPIEFPIEGTHDAFAKVYAKNAMWKDERRWHLWYFMEDKV